jgi:ceramide glucosyltransferase
MDHVLVILAFLSLILALWQWIAACRFNLHKRLQHNTFTPPVTVLKPVKGWDDKSAVAIESWLNQDYPGSVQVLFGVKSPGDPAAEEIASLLLKHPGAQAQLLICPESLGVNAKASTLIQLFRRVKSEVVVVSDADVFVPKDYLRNVVAPLESQDIGLVNSFYRLVDPANLAMRCEALAANADFWSQVLQGRTMAPLDFALGAVMATRREQITAIGGFEALADYLADDFQLGNRVTRTGRRIALCPVVADCLSPSQDWRQVWAHQVRWARTIRVCKPVPYAFSILSNATLWPLLWLLSEPTSTVLAIFTGCIGVRVMEAHLLQRRLAPNDPEPTYAWLAPFKDILSFLLWTISFCGNRIEWRGEQFRLERDGKLVRA